ncbi:two-component system regulatory protein YycI [Bacillus sp. REN10]|uniref:two-component system regulatory protein YycI n=1 Tax=Bacillus sp. REN10 TaxID=2782541 RepID=UPI00193B4941|nr:two-component system regulatory protein YycI [Bacillus sp. REN10]
MDWSKAKTIFIAVFLILNIFLLLVFFNKDRANQYVTMKEEPIEEKLKAYNIDYGELPNDVTEAAIITAKSKSFSKKEFEKLDNQQIQFLDSPMTIEGVLQKPVPLGENKVHDIRSFVNNQVVYGKEYRYWGTEGKIVTFYQHVNNKKLFENIKGRLEIHLNDNGEVIKYKQTLLGEVEENSKKETIISAFQAIQSLYKNGLIKQNSKILHTELGYYTVVRLTEAQVLSPTWYFKIKNNDKVEKVYVNALEGTIYTSEMDSQK